MKILKNLIIAVFGLFFLPIYAQNSCKTDTARIDTSICASNNGFLYHGQVYTQPGIYTQQFKNYLGCDSTVVLTVSFIRPPMTTPAVVRTAGFCSNDKQILIVQAQTSQHYQWCKDYNGKEVFIGDSLYLNDTITTIYYVRAFEYTECFGPFARVENIIHKAYKKIIIDTAYSNYKLNNETYTESGTYYQNYVTSYGCDSTLILKLKIIEPVSITICAGDTVNGVVYNNGGVFSSVVAKKNNRDSLLKIYVKEPYLDTIEQASCNSYLWNNHIYTKSGIYKQNFTSVHGCDSIIILNLTINQPSFRIITDTACNYYSINNQTYKQSGTYVQTLINQFGCDSVLQLNLTIFPSSSNTIIDTACYSYFINGQTFFTSGIYTQKLVNKLGCDSVLILDLTILPSHERQIIDTVCDIYSLNNNIYTESGIYKQTLINRFGCDSVITLYLTVNRTTSRMFICAGENVNGVIYNETGTFTQTRPNSLGCDSVISIEVTKLDAPTVSILGENCSNRPHFLSVDNQIFNPTINYQWYKDSSFNKPIAGANRPFYDPVDSVTSIYYVGSSTTLSNGKQCYSPLTKIINTVLSSKISITRDTTIKRGESLTLSVSGNIMTSNWNTGQTSPSITVSPERDKVYYVSGETRCDFRSYSDTIHVIVDTSDKIKAHCTVSGCGSVVYNGRTFTQNGDYFVNLKDAKNNDSLVLLHISILHATGSQINKTAYCHYELNNQTYTQSGVYTQILVNKQGCDSVITLNLTISDTITTCIGGVVFGKQYNELGAFRETIIPQNGCDSLITVVVIKPDAPASFNIKPICSYNQQVQINFYSTKGESIFRAFSDSLRTKTLAIHGENLSISNSDITNNYVYLDQVLNGCVSPLTKAEIPINAIPVFASAKKQTVNMGDSATLSVRTNKPSNFYWSTEGYSWSLSNYFDSVSTITFKPRASDWYHVQSDMCGTEENVYIEVIPCYTDTSEIDTTICAGIFSYYGVAYQQEGTYTQLIKNEMGCDSAVIIHLHFNALPDVKISGKEKIQTGETVCLKASGAKVYEWNTHSTFDWIRVKPLFTTEYWVNGVDSNNCSARAKFTISLGDSVVSKVAIIPEKIINPIPYKYQLEAIVTPKDAIDQRIRWESSDTNIVSVNSQGIIISTRKGSATIKAISLNNAKSYDSCIVVVDSVIEIPSIAKIGIYVTTQFAYPGSKIETFGWVDYYLKNGFISKGTLLYQSTDTTILTVSASGEITCKKEGYAYVIGLDSSGSGIYDKKLIVIQKPSTSYLTLNYSSVTLEVDSSIQLRSDVSPVEASKNTKVYWKSSDDRIAIVDSNGFVVAKSVGTITIIAITDEGIQQKCFISVVNHPNSVILATELLLNDTIKRLDIGETFLIKAQIAPLNVTDSIIHWSSSDERIVKVGENGLVTAVNIGEVFVFARTNNDIISRCKIIINPSVIYGCTNSKAINYYNLANTDNNTCLYTIVVGCMDTTAINFNMQATVADNSCLYSRKVFGCTDNKASNYNMQATFDDGYCIYPLVIRGCIDPIASNFNPKANISDYSCLYSDKLEVGCMDSMAYNYNRYAKIDNGRCDYPTVNDSIFGCKDRQASNFNIAASIDDTCIYTLSQTKGCVSKSAINYMPNATVNDSSCVFAKKINTKTMINTKEKFVDTLATEAKEICDFDFSVPIDTVFVESISYEEGNSVRVNWCIIQHDKIYKTYNVYSYSKMGKMVIYLAIVCNGNKLKSFGNENIKALSFAAIINVEKSQTELFEHYLHVSAYAYPQPTSETLNVYYDSPIDGRVLISLNTTNGQVIQNELLELKRGVNIYQFNTSSLFSGVYLISIKANGVLTNTIRVVKK